MNDRPDFDGDAFSDALHDVAPPAPDSFGLSGAQLEARARRRHVVRRYGAVTGAALSVTVIAGGAYLISSPNGASTDHTATGVHNGTNGVGDQLVEKQCPATISPDTYSRRNAVPPKGTHIVAAGICKYRFDGTTFKLASSKQIVEPRTLRMLTVGVQRSRFNVWLSCPLMPANAPKNQIANVIVLTSRDGTAYVSDYGPWCVESSFHAGPSSDLLFPSQLLQKTLAQIGADGPLAKAGPPRG